MPGSRFTSAVRSSARNACSIPALEVSKETLNVAIHWLTDRAIGQKVRALAAIFAAKHGSPQQKSAVKSHYERESSPFVRAAILYGSRFFVTAERRAMLKAWGGLSTVNALIAKAVRKLATVTA